MLSPQQLIGFSSPGEETGSGPNMPIGLIDGPVDSSHPDFDSVSIRTIHAGPSSCELKSSPACIHGTFVAGVLAARRSSPYPGLVPETSVITRSLFCEAADLRQCPVVTPQHLAEALNDVVNAGAKVVNLSLGLAQSSLGNYDVLHNAFDRAQKQGVLLVGASGNQGRVGHNPLFDHPWVIPVAACDLQGRVAGASNIGKSVGQRGLLAPGVQIEGLYAGGGYTKMSGTSIAAPFVTGSISKLWGEFPGATAQQVHQAILTGDGLRRRGIVPPLLNLGNSRSFLSGQFARRARPQSFVNLA